MPGDGMLTNNVGTHWYVSGEPVGASRAIDYLGPEGSIEIVTRLDESGEEYSVAVFTPTGGAGISGPGGSVDTSGGSIAMESASGSDPIVVSAAGGVSFTTGVAGLFFSGTARNIRNVANPTLPQDVATKDYVDDALEAGVPSIIANNEVLTGPGIVNVNAADGYDLNLGGGGAGAGVTNVQGQESGGVAIFTHSVAPVMNGGDVHVKAVHDVVISGAETTSGVSVRAGGLASTTLADGEMKLRGDRGISMRAAGAPAAPAVGQILIVGTTIELTGTLTNNGSPISSGGGSSIANGSGTPGSLAIDSSKNLTTAQLASITFDTPGTAKYQGALGFGLAVTPTETVLDADNGNAVRLQVDNARVLLDVGDMVDISGYEINVRAADGQLYLQGGADPSGTEAISIYGDRPTNDRAVPRILIQAARATSFATAVTANKNGGTVDLAGGEPRTAGTDKSGPVRLALGVERTSDPIGSNVATGVEFWQSVSGNPFSLRLGHMMDRNGNLGLRAEAGNLELFSVASLDVYPGTSFSVTAPGAASIATSSNLQMYSTGAQAGFYAYAVNGELEARSTVSKITLSTGGRIVEINDGPSTGVVRERHHLPADTPTSDATLTTLATFTPTARPSTYEIVVHAFSSSVVARWRTSVTGFLFGGAAVVAHYDDNNFATGVAFGGAGALATAALTIDVSGTTFRIRGAGVAATNLTWVVTVREVK